MFRAQRRDLRLLLLCPLAGVATLLPTLAAAAVIDPPSVAGIPFEFILFAATLAGLALLHRHTSPLSHGSDAGGMLRRHA